MGEIKNHVKIPDFNPQKGYSFVNEQTNEPVKQLKKPTNQFYKMEEYIGIVKLFAGNFAPRGYMFCDGKLLSIAQYTALFSIIGTTYGGDGQTSFALPDLRGRVAMSAGKAPALSLHREGEMAGTENVTLLSVNMPPHTHPGAIKVSSQDATEPSAQFGSSLAAPGFLNGRDFESTLGYNEAAPDTTLSTDSVQVGISGNGVPFNIMQPYLVMNYIICYEGIFPSRP